MIMDELKKNPDCIDIDGCRWCWCDGCEGYRSHEHATHTPGHGYTADDLARELGLLTFTTEWR
jgi:hypothetical protein